MATYPSIPVDAATRVELDDNIALDAADDGVVNHRVGYTITLISARIVHDQISSAERNTLRTFYDSNKQEAIVWYYQDLTYTLHFRSRPQEQYLEGGRWRVICDMVGRYSPSAIVQSLQPLTQSATGSVSNTTRVGTITQALAAPTQTAVGAAVTPGAVEGTASQTLADLTQSAAGTVAGGTDLANLIIDSVNLTTGWWVNAGCVRVYDSGGNGPDGGNSTTLEDDSAISAEHIRMNIESGGTTESWAARFFVKKDATRTGSPYAEFRITFSDSAGSGTSSPGIRLRINLSTGAYDTPLNTGSNGAASVATYDTDWWEVKIDAPNTGADYWVQIALYPAAGTALNSQSYVTSPLGEMIIGNVELYRNKTIEDISGGPVRVLTAYRLDGSDASASGTNWSTLSSLTDTNGSSYTTLSSPNENVLTAAGTNASGSGSITGVAMRYRPYSTGPTYTFTTKIWTDGQAQLLITDSARTVDAATWTSLLPLALATGGWSWTKIQGLEYEMTPAYVSGSGSVGVGIVEFYVSEQ